jgi:hypothetical protein
MSEGISLKKEHMVYKVIIEAEIVGEFMHARHHADIVLNILKRELRAAPLFYQIQKCTIDVPGMYD